MRQFDDSYALNADAAVIARQLIESISMFAHLGEARILYISSQRQPMLHGHPCQAFVAEPRVQGPFRPLFDWMLAGLGADVFEQEEPDLVVMIDAALWQSFDAEHREWLVYHELRHVEQKCDPETGLPKFSKEDGRPMLRIVSHDAEFFFDEVERYGPDTTGQVEATIALASGGEAASRRREAATTGQAVAAGSSGQ